MKIRLGKTVKSDYHPLRSDDDVLSHATPFTQGISGMTAMVSAPVLKAKRQRGGRKLDVFAKEDPLDKVHENYCRRYLYAWNAYQAARGTKHETECLAELMVERGPIKDLLSRAYRGRIRAFGVTFMLDQNQGIVIRREAAKLRNVAPFLLRGRI